MSTEIVSFGPRELRVVKDAGWSLPVFCDPHSSNAVDVTHWAVRPAMELLADPFSQLSSRFGPNNLGTSSTFWVVATPVLDQLSSRVPGCVPSDYLKWDGTRQARELAGVEVGVNDTENEFLNFCCDRASVDRPLGRFVWRAIKEGAMCWLIEHQRPIDMEVFTVHPVPFRANWKEILLAKHPRSPRIFAGKRENWRDRMVSWGFMEDIGSTDLLAMRRGNTFSWTLEVQQSKMLVDEWTRAEETNLATKRQTKYASYYESCVRKRLEDIITIFASWLRQVQQKVGSIRESPVTGDPILVPISKRKRVLPRWHKPQQVTFQPTNGQPSLVQGQGRGWHMESKTKDLFLLPPVLQGAEDVRGREIAQDLDRPGDGTAGTGGVLLLHAAKGEAAPEPVLAVGKELKS